jgi:hypothetical protein
MSTYANPTALLESVHEADESLVRLFRVALRALAEADASLAKAFSHGMIGAGGFYGGVNHGLAYAVYEPQIVCEIFKAWMPHVRVRWESSVYPGTNRRADLAVFDDDLGTNVRWVFEAKWWGRSTKTMLDVLRADIKKLGECDPGAKRRFLLTFWWTEDSGPAHSRALADVEDFCRKHPMVQTRYTGSIPTDCVAATDRRGAFTVAVLEVMSQSIASECYQ